FRQCVLRAAHVNRKQPRGPQQIADIRRTARMFRVARKFCLSERLAAHEIPSVANHSSKGRICWGEQNTSEMKSFSNCFDLGRHLSTQNGIYLLVNPLCSARRQRAGGKSCPLSSFFGS